MWTWKMVGLFVALVVCFALAGDSLHQALAQDAAKEAPQAPAVDPAKEIAALKQQLAQLQQQAQQPQLSPAQQMQQAQAGYTAIFKEAKEKAGPGCKAAGGKLLVTVLADGKATVACAW